MGSEVVPTPADVMAKATRMLKRVMLLQMVWFLCFFAGGVLMVWTAWRNTHLPATCTSGVRATASVIASCEHHSYHWPVLLVLVGIAGLFVTGYVATRLAVKYLGAGATAFSSMLTTSSKTRRPFGKPALSPPTTPRMAAFAGAVGSIATLSRSMSAFVAPVLFWNPAMSPAGTPVSRTASRSGRVFEEFPA